MNTSSSRLRPRFTMRRLALVVMLAATWCGLWGEFSVANVLSGVALGVVTTTPIVMTTLGRPIGFAALVQCIAIVLIDLVKSTVTVVYEVLTPTDYTNERTIEVDVGATGVRHLFLLVVAITLTPGTAVIDVDTDGGTLLLHLLHGENEPDVRQHVDQLVTLAERALPSVPEAIADPDADRIST